MQNEKYRQAVEKFIAEVDKDKNGKVSLQEVLALCPDEEYQRTTKQYFSKYDLNKDGELDSSELYKLLETCFKGK
ncbi:unnamed protein product [Echinostoma caproni]|uniref:EF-hand domain-containing protein n=1 Tax=Echinostoma caproni TaxID=27848 RepID=A0A183AWF0_9TREM|nr:unnamed protein product [Echinostoma caproni]